jgi:hypothetical protein
MASEDSYFRHRRIREATESRDVSKLSRIRGPGGPIQAVVGSRPFLLIVRTGRIVTVHSHLTMVRHGRVPPDTRSFQQIAEFVPDGYPSGAATGVYGRRLPGLRFRASPEG